MKEPEKFIAYYRVSTDKQGIRGLGMESQVKQVNDYIERVGGKLISSFEEVMSGRTSKKNPQLLEALKECKKQKATLIVAKLDRLSRNIHFITGLQEAKIKFIALDCPEANETMIQFLSIFAQFESKKISERTKAALAMKKLKGDKLGGPNIKELSVLIAKKKREKAMLFAMELEPICYELICNGYTQSRIANELMRHRFKTSGGSENWSQKTVSKLLKWQRIAKENGLEQEKNEHKCRKSQAKMA